MIKLLFMFLLLDSSMVDDFKKDMKWLYGEQNQITEILYLGMDKQYYDKSTILFDDYMKTFTYGFNTDNKLQSITKLGETNSEKLYSLIIHEKIMLSCWFGEPRIVADIDVNKNYGNVDILLYEWIKGNVKCHLVFHQYNQFKSYYINIEPLDKTLIKK